jgi:hypothetical protein
MDEPIDRLCSGPAKAWKLAVNISGKDNRIQWNSNPPVSWGRTSKKANTRLQLQTHFTH